MNYILSRNYTPVLVALNNHLFKALKKIVTHPKFEASTKDVFGVSILTNLIFILATDESSKESDKIIIKETIEYILETDKFDLNFKEVTNDTPINIACLYPKLSWIVEKMANNVKVNINIENSKHFTPLETAIRSNNINAIKILCKRSDLIVSNEDIENARLKCINLEDYLNYPQAKN